MVRVNLPKLQKDKTKRQQEKISLKKQKEHGNRETNKYCC